MQVVTIALGVPHVWIAAIASLEAVAPSEDAFLHVSSQGNPFGTHEPRECQALGRNVQPHVSTIEQRIDESGDTRPAVLETSAQKSTPPGGGVP